MRRWLADALLILCSSLVGLIAYDTVSIVIMARGDHRLEPVHELAIAATEDTGLALVYAMTITPRVTHVITTSALGTRRACLIMLGLGLAWYEVVCASVTRLVTGPPGLVLSLVMLFGIPMILAPWYAAWLMRQMDQT